jgi:hypothetical protein
MKTIYFYDIETLLYKYDFAEVPEDESLPEGATDEKPIDDATGLYFVHAKWSPEQKKWVEGGTKPTPTTPEPSDMDKLKQQNSQLTMMLVELEQKNATVSKQYSNLLKELTLKGVI